MVDSPFFSIITATYNVGGALEATARTLRKQSFRSFEWLVVDGASTDGTVEAIKRLGEEVSWWTSGPDTGVYDAWNKALPHVRGQWLLFLGAGDEIVDASVLDRVAAKLRSFSDETTTAYGVVLVKVEGGERVKGRGWLGLGSRWGGGRPSMPCHQGVFQRTTLFRSGFRFDARCRIAADGEIVLRELIAGHGQALGLTIARFEAGGISDRAETRLRMVGESIYVNFKIGIFWRRPFYQFAALALAAARHALLKLRRSASRN